MAGFDDTFFECSICNKTVEQCQICNSASSLKDICQNIKESPYFEETTWLALMKHFLSVQYVIEQLGSVKFIILPHLSKISVKTSKESPYFEKITWLALMAIFWMFNMEFVFTFHALKWYVCSKLLFWRKLVTFQTFVGFFISCTEVMCVLNSSFWRKLKSNFKHL